MAFALCQIQCRATAAVRHALLRAASDHADDALRMWAERVTPLPVAEIPPSLADSPPDIRGLDLSCEPLSEIPSPPRSKRSPAPPQSAPFDFAGRCFTSADEFLTPAARRRFARVVDEHLRDLRSIARDGAAVQRARPHP